MGRGSLSNQNINLHVDPQNLSKPRSLKHKLTKNLEQKLKEISKHDQSSQDNQADPHWNKLPFKANYLTKIRIATINIRGFKEVEKQEYLMFWMDKNKIDIVALQGTYVNTNSKLKRGNFTFFTLPTSQTKTEKMPKNKLNPRPKAKAKLITILKDKT